MPRKECGISAMRRAEQLIFGRRSGLGRGTWAMRKRVRVVESRLCLEAVKDGSYLARCQVQAAVSL